MGNCFDVPGAVDHWIYVKTGDRKGAGTDAKVKIILYDQDGRRSPEIELDCLYKNDFERNNTDVFQVPYLGSEFGLMAKIEVWRENGGAFPDWYCDLIIVTDTRKGDKERSFYFPIQAWVKAYQHYTVHVNGTHLSQDDPTPETRSKELEVNLMQYQLAQMETGLPIQVRNLPEDEVFSNDYKWDILSLKAKLIAKSSLRSLTNHHWESFADLRSIYDQTPDGLFPEPVGLERWGKDVCFGAQRLIGCNPTQIRLCHRLPENIAVTADMLLPFLEGWNLKQIINARRLFVVDHKILRDLPTTNNRVLPCPIALFFVTGDKSLVPIAIQLYQHVSKENPVFLPDDPPFTWILAKMWFNLADSSVHQALSHLGFTHLLMEGFCIATHRRLSRKHPIYKLLAPHFLYLLAINWRGISKLLGENGWVDKTMTIGRKGLFELIKRGLANWRIDLHGNFPKDLEDRGVLDPRVLPNYGYRDDGLLIHKAIENYVIKIIKHYYNAPKKIIDDQELQNWGAELATKKEYGGIGIRGMPNGGQFRHTDDVALVCTSIILTCSLQHAATNFSQYEEYGFPANYPAFLHGEPPRDKYVCTEEEVVHALPTQSTTLDTMVVTKLLSSRGTNKLGDFETKFQFDPVVVKYEEEFRDDLKKISEIVYERNEMRNPVFKYPYLNPEIIPNSISI